MPAGSRGWTGCTGWMAAKTTTSSRAVQAMTQPADVAESTSCMATAGLTYCLANRQTRFVPTTNKNFLDEATVVAIRVVPGE